MQTTQTVQNNTIHPNKLRTWRPRLSCRYPGYIVKEKIDFYAPQFKHYIKTFCQIMTFAISKYAPWTVMLVGKSSCVLLFKCMYYFVLHFKFLRPVHTIYEFIHSYELFIQFIWMVCAYSVHEESMSRNACIMYVNRPVYMQVYLYVERQQDQAPLSGDAQPVALALKSKNNISKILSH